MMMRCDQMSPIHTYINKCLVFERVIFHKWILQFHYIIFPHPHPITAFSQPYTNRALLKGISFSPKSSGPLEIERTFKAFCYPSQIHI